MLILVWFIWLSNYMPQFSLIACLDVVDLWLDTAKTIKEFSEEPESLIAPARAELWARLRLKLTTSFCWRCFYGNKQIIMNIL